MHAESQRGVADRCLTMVHAAAQAFENELRKHLATERDAAGIVPMSTIGCLCVETAPLKASLRAEAAAWKTQFAKNLHKQGYTDLSVRAAGRTLAP